MQSNFRAKSGTENAAQAGRMPARFVEHMQQLFGEEPDPLFLEESWRMGVAAATERMERRRQQRVEREKEVRDAALRELGRIASVRGRREAVSEAEELGWKAGAWVPADWVPADQVVQRALPHGWMPEGVPRQDFEWKTGPSETGGAMTVAYAERMLGVTAGDSREAVRSAYRRRVGMCHPDKHQSASEAVKARATRQMAELNEAYRMLCAGLMEEAA
ncbi:MAG TPA: J domain-containing protein [Acidobacteriaceae bacterium]|nr:J domain-containing protein [Acidobacteriaceae bacterium]